MPYTFFEIIFWLCLAIALHTYILFPVIIRFFARVAGKPRRVELSEVDYPRLSVVISALNEESVIQERLDNLAAQHYPKDKFEVLIGSDGSTDATNDILNHYAQRYTWLRVFCYGERRGKASVLNDLVRETTADILVFGDADHFYEPDALQQIIPYFGDEHVGGVAGTIDMRNAPGKESAGLEEQSYYSYDNPIKIAEGDCGCMIGAHGGFFAIRRELYADIPVSKGVTDDFYVSILPLEKGYKVVAAREAISHTYSAPSTAAEFRRKVRFSATSFATLFRFRKLLFDRRLILSYAFWSHRVSKWLFPLVMIVIFFLNLLLMNWHPVYRLLMYGQYLLYISACIGYVLSKYGVSIRLFSFPYYFVVSNAALFFGLIRFLRGKNVTHWQPARAKT